MPTSAGPRITAGLAYVTMATSLSFINNLHLLRLHWLLVLDHHTEHTANSHIYQLIKQRFYIPRVTTQVISEMFPLEVCTEMGF